MFLTILNSEVQELADQKTNEIINRLIEYSKSNNRKLSHYGQSFFLQLESLEERYAGIVINIVDFNKIFLLSKEKFMLFTPITIREVLETGLYGSYKNMNIWLSKKIEPGFFEVK